MHASFTIRRGLLFAAAAALLAALVLAILPASAQTNTNPKVHQTPLKDDGTETSFVIDDKGATEYTHVELRLGSGADGRTPATYLDYGSVHFWLERRPSGGRLDDGNFFASAGLTDGNAGTALAACDGGYADRCELNKDEWKALADQSTATDSDTVMPIKIAFTVPTSVSQNIIRFGVVHYSQDAVRRTGGGSLWGPNQDWTVLEYGAIITPVDADDNPLYVRNSLTQTPHATMGLQYLFAANQLSHVRLEIGASRALGFTGEPLNNIRYSQFGEVRLGFWAPNEGSVLNTGSQGGYHATVIRKSDGMAFDPCDESSGTRCIIDKTEWQAAAGQMGVDDDTFVKPIRFALKWLNTGHDGTTPWNGASVRFYAEFQLSGTSTYEHRNVDFQRLSAHISRLQTGARGVGAIEPNANSEIADGDHIAVDCKQAIHITGGTDVKTDCNRAVEVGEGVYLENILRASGAADNTGRSTSTGRSNDAWLRVDAARHGVFFDRIEVTATTNNAPGGGVVAISSLCPIDAPATPEHPSGMANVPRGRTAEALAKCVYNRSIASGTYWGGTGPNFFPTTSTGPVTVTVTYRKGDDDTTTLNIDESLVATDSLVIPVAAASDNIETDPDNGGWDESELVAELGQRSREDSLILLIGHRRDRGIPEFWRGLTAPGGPGTIKGATYGALAASGTAISLTVPSGGTLSLLGTDLSCTADSAPCTLNITRSELAEAACYGGPAGCTTDANPANTPYWPARLRFDHVGTSDVTISGVMTPSSGDPYEFSYVAKAGGHDATVAAFLPADADKILSPGDTTALGVGYRVPEEGDIEWRAYSPSPAFYVITGYPTSGNPAPMIELSTALATPLAAVTDGAYLSLQGPATWADNGGRRLRMGLDGYGYFRCADVSDLTGVDTDEGRACYITDMNGNAPQVTVASDADEDIRVFADFPLWTLFGAVAPDATHSGGPGHGYFRAQNVHAMQRIDQFGSATLKVAAVSQLTSIALDRKPVDGNVPTAPIRIGGSGDVRLALSNADGAPSQLSSVSAITITVIGGGTLSGFGCENVSSCTIEGDSGALFEDAKTDPGVTAEIDLTYKATNTPGEATVEATVVGIDGMTFSERLVLTISGSATEIATSGDMPRVHSSATEDDDRDKVLIPVTARDANGNAARMPTNAAATVRGIDRAVVPSSSLTSEVVCTDGEARLRCNVEIVVTAAPGSALKSGAYTATVSGSRIGNTDVGFAVGGPAETVTLEVPATADLPGLAGSFTATASVVDMAGVPVADGTWVMFRTTAASSRTASAIVTRPPLTDHDNNEDTAAIRRTKTKNGVAEATVTVVGNGIAILTATVGDKTANEPINTRVEAVAAAPVDGPKLRFETPDETAATGALATWIATASGDAREALEEVSGASVVWLWNGVEWIRWGLTEEGTPIPGSSPTPFTVLTSDRLWFAD